MLEMLRQSSSSFKKYMPVKVVAISDDYLAGVIVHDEWFREKGIRAVYITFEPEASSDAAVWKFERDDRTRKRDGYSN